jgi:hypothetical protein
VTRLRSWNQFNWKYEIHGWQRTKLLKMDRSEPSRACGRGYCHFSNERRKIGELTPIPNVFLWTHFVLVCFWVMQLVGRLTKNIAETFTACNPNFKCSVQPKHPRRYLTSPSKGVSNDGQDNMDADLILYDGCVLVNEQHNIRSTLMHIYMS